MSKCTVTWFVYNPITLGQSTPTVQDCKFDGSEGFNSTIQNHKENTVIKYRFDITWTDGRVTQSPALNEPFRWHAYFVEPIAPVPYDTFHIFLTPTAWSQMYLDTVALDYSEHILDKRAIIGTCNENKRWNVEQNATFIFKGIVYDVGIRLQGSLYNRPFGDQVNLAAYAAAGGVRPDRLGGFRTWSYKINLPHRLDINGNDILILHKGLTECAYYATPLTNRMALKMGLPASSTSFARVRCEN